MVLGIYALYLTFLFIRAGEIDWVLLSSVIYMPIVFIVMLILFDLIMAKFMPKKFRKVEDRYREFINVAAKKVNDIDGFNLEDFRRLRESEKFQKALYQCFTIYENGETESLNFTYLAKKFKPSSNESKALEIVINETKEMIENK